MLNIYLKKILLTWHICIEHTRTDATLSAGLIGCSLTVTHTHTHKGARWATRHLFMPACLKAGTQQSKARSTQARGLPRPCLQTVCRKAAGTADRNTKRWPQRRRSFPVGGLLHPQLNHRSLGGWEWSGSEGRRTGRRSFSITCPYGCSGWSERWLETTERVRRSTQATSLFTLGMLPWKSTLFKIT